MQQTPQIRAELNRCELLLEMMAATSSAAEFQEHWHQFLGHLERTWNKCEAHFGKSPKWNGWKGRFDKQRRTDPLLSYLSNARGAHEHTVAEITEQTLGSMSIGAGPGGTVRIRQLRIGPEGIQGDWDGDLALTFTPGEVIPMPVTNRGRTYSVPKIHLGEKLPNSSALTLGRYALTYYRNFLAKAEAVFIERTAGL